jgi:hypothetical protein
VSNVTRRSAALGFRVGQVPIPKTNQMPIRKTG